jgi:diacylglycerol kinase (ATP)
LVGGEMIRRMARPFRGSVAFETDSEAEDRGAWAERDYLAVAAGTIANIGLNFRPFHRYAEKPGRFHMLGINASPVAFVKELPRIHREEPMRRDKTYEAVSSRAVVRSADGTVRYMIDGDLHETRGELEVAIGPRVKLVIIR